MSTHDDGTVLSSIRHPHWSSYHSNPRWATEFPHSAETFFTLPVPSHELYLLSRGSYQHGNLRVKQQGQHFTVTVRIAYHHTSALARATVCQLQKPGNRNGVGIYTPTTWHSPTDRLRCDVVLTLPAAHPDTPLRIPKLTFSTSNFAHEIDNIWNTVLVDDLEIATSNGAVDAKAITLTTGKVTSSNGAIRGHFNACDLTLTTSNAPIDVSVSLFSSGHTAKLNMHTSNAWIASVVTLVAEGAGSFNVSASSSNGSVGVRYEDVSGKLVSNVRTSNGQANVVAPGFEGAFRVSTSNASAVVNNTHVRDPTGAGRRRVVERQIVRLGRVEGRAGWGATRGNGKCDVHSSNAGATLDL